MKFGKIFPFLKTDNRGKNIILTGIPRSGTTLACRLLSEYSQTIALNEPLDQSLFANVSDANKNINSQFLAFRKSLLKTGTALARTQEGKITDNAFSHDSQNRERVVKRSVIHFDKKLDPDFTLIMKHCAEFTLLMPDITQQYEVYAIIRNPLAVLSSWTSVDVPVSRGNIPKSAKLNPSFHKSLNEHSEELLERQLFILSWYFGQYNTLDSEHIIRYEEFVDNPDKSFVNIAKGSLLTPFQKLTNKNSNTLYNKSGIRILGDALLKSEGNYWRYYSKENVSLLLDKINSDEA